LAVVGTLPLLFDGYQLDVEQFILTETLFDVLLVAGLVFLVWRPRPRAWQGAAAGFLLAAATLTRSAALPLLIVAGLYLLARRAWRGLLGGVAVAVVVLVGYAGWFAAVNGPFGFSEYNGFYLYGRVAPFVTCDYHLTAAEKRLCPLSRIGKRPVNDEFFVWAGRSRLYQGGLGTHEQVNNLADKFSIEVIEHQPRAYVDAVATDVWHFFAPGRWMKTDKIDMVRWRFPGPVLHTKRHKLHVAFANSTFDVKKVGHHVTVGLTAPLRSYQSFVYTPGPLLLACLVGSLLAAAGLVRRKTRMRLNHARWVALVLAASALVLVVGPSLVTGFSYRYQLPLLVLLPPAAMVAAEVGLLRIRRAPSPAQEAPEGRR
jgi:hypothetical protein